MATQSNIPLYTTTLTGSAATVNIPLTGISGYQDLEIVCSVKTVSGTKYIQLVLNSDSTGTSYSQTSLYGNGTNALSSRNSNAPVGYLAQNANINSSNFSIYRINLLSYANSSIFKTIITRSGSAEIETSAVVGTWRNTNPITSILLQLNSGSFAAGSTFSLYGDIAEGVTPAAKATGGVIYDDTDFYYHVFGSTGTFTPLSSLTADILVVAGGGGGGGGGSTWANGGGGGAGGLLAFTNQSLSATGYTITVGSGGTGGVGYNASGGSAGTNSQFGALTASVGGGFGGGWAQAVTSGGSGGGGAGYTSTGSNNGASGTAGQGFAGGNGVAPADNTGNGGGGGGAGGAGQNAGARGSTFGGNGGIGATSSFINMIGAATGAGQLSSGNYYFAGGGGGGSGTAGNFGIATAGGGNGGGGNVSGSSAAFATGGGGGGAGAAGSGGATNGGNGGSGVVIVRYAK